MANSIPSASSDLAASSSGSPCREWRWLFLVTWLGSFCVVAGPAIADPDLWGHTLYGLRSIELGVMTEATDPFSYTAAGERWVNHEWLTEWTYGWGWRIGGDTGLAVVRWCWLVVLWSILSVSLVRERPRLGTAVLALLFSALVLVDFTIFLRPQLSTFAGVATWLWVMSEVERQGRVRWLFLLPPLMVVWVNSHGGFLAGVGLQGAWTAGLVATQLVWPQADRGRLAGLSCGAFVLAVAATLVTPYGLELHEMLWHHLGTYQPVREWKPLWAARPSAALVAPFVLLAIALVGWRRWRITDVVLAMVLCWQAVSHLRHLALLQLFVAIRLAPALDAGLAALFPRLTERWSENKHRGLRIVLVLGAVMSAVALQVELTQSLFKSGILPWMVAADVIHDVPGVPEQAVRWMRERELAGNLVTDYGWGQYVIWHLYPEVRVAFDGRYRTVYPADVEADFMAFQTMSKTPSGGIALLDDYPTDFVLLPTQRHAAAVLREIPNWETIYEDSQAIVFARRGAWEGVPLSTGIQGPSSRPERPWSRFPAGPREQPAHELR